MISLLYIHSRHIGDAVDLSTLQGEKFLLDKNNFLGLLKKLLEFGKHFLGSEKKQKGAKVQDL